MNLKVNQKVASISCFPMKYLKIETECSENNEQLMADYNASSIIMNLFLDPKPCQTLYPQASKQLSFNTQVS